MKQWPEQKEQTKRGPCLVLTTMSNREQAEDIARQLVKQKLIACVNIVDNVCSVYQWQSEIQTDREALMIMKSSWQGWPALSAAIKTLHPYQVPELIALNIDDGMPDYLQWLAATTLSKDSSRD